LTSFTGNLGDGGTQRTYSTGVSYSSLGGMQQEQFGTQTAVYHKLHYNVRGQLNDIRASTVAWQTDQWNWNRGAIINYYATADLACQTNDCRANSGSDNNGNVRQSQHWVPANDQISSYNVIEDRFSYDSLNRLESISEYQGTQNGLGPQVFAQAYTYDRWGNRRIDNGATWGSGINNGQSWIDQTNNRLYAPGDQNVPDPEQRLIRYDAAGNQKADYYSANWQGTRTYDAENRIKTATNTSNITSTYVYDGDGHRIKRIVGNTETWQIYGLGDELVAEYSANTAAGSPQNEYGYRNGELLITATVPSGWGSPPTLDDNPLNPPNQPRTDVKAIHITQLRDAINAVRGHYNLPNYSWQKPTASNGAINNSVLISWEPIDEMRTALDQALGAPSGGYSPGLALGEPIKAIHIQELRDRVLAAWQTGGGLDLRWLVADQLGTPRMVFDQTGSLANMSRHDYLPFGEEVPAGFRSGMPGYATGDSVRQKFTQKERDTETGLDYFGARYYSNSQGRFTSSDPIALNSERLQNPQLINLYTYAGNNPLKFVDPNGEDKVTVKSRTYTFEIEKKGKKFSQHVIVTVKETTAIRTDNQGNVIQRGTSAEATAVNADDAKNPMSGDQLKQIGIVAGMIAEQAALLNVDRGVAFAIAERETFFGTENDGYNSTYNPMKVTSGTGRKELNPGSDMRDNITKAMLWLGIVTNGTSMENGLQHGYGPGPGKPGGANYGKSVMNEANRINAEMGGSIRTTAFYSYYSKPGPLPMGPPASLRSIFRKRF
jgi:RHS repeat-associated protein